MPDDFPPRPPPRPQLPAIIPGEGVKTHKYRKRKPIQPALEPFPAYADQASPAAQAKLHANRLLPLHKARAVELLARWVPLQRVCDALLAEFGVSITVWSARYYNPELREGVSLSKDLRELFYREREKFVNSVNKMPLSQAAYRVERYQSYVENLEAVGAWEKAAQVVRQAAQDLGGMFNAQGKEPALHNTGSATIDLEALDDNELVALEDLLSKTKAED